MSVYASLFIDYENVYYHLTNKYADIPELNDYVIDLLMNLNAYLEKEYGLLTIISNAYADYERIKATPQQSLFLSGVETVYVMGTDHKNAADMRLCIDAMDVLAKRPEIDTFVVFAGDRDYIPLIQHLKKQAKKVFAVGFESSFSGDLLTNVGQSNFIDALKLFAPERLRKLEESASRQKDYEKAEAERDAERTKALKEKVSKETSVKKRAAEPPEDGHWFNIVNPDLNDEERTCLQFIITEYGRHHEIWLGPLLDSLPQALPTLADYQRKRVISDLEHKGAFCIEKRIGTPHDYAVAILNYNHPVVREMC
ncbi:NYN domain-containing protein [bacterium]|nr:NYN domain-containing protein [bacterium]